MAFVTEVLIRRNANNVKTPTLLTPKLAAKPLRCTMLKSVSLFPKVFLVCLYNDKHAFLLSLSAAHVRYFDVKLG